MGGDAFFHDWKDDCNFIEEKKDKSSSYLQRTMKKKNPSIGLQFLGSSLLSWNALAVEICI
jgi:hypothetical protein